MNNNHTYLFLLLVLLLCCLSAAPLGPEVNGFILVVAALWLVVSTWNSSLGGMFVLVSSFSLKDPIRVVFMFASTLLHLSLSSGVCSSTLTSNLVYMMCFMNVTYYFFVLFVAPKTSFVQL